MISRFFVFIALFLSFCLVVAPGCGDGEDGDGSNDSEDSGEPGDDDSQGQHPLGRVFLKTPDDGDPVDVLLTGLPEDASVLTGDTFEVFTCTGDDCFSDVEQLAAADEDGDFLIDPLLDPAYGSDPAAEVNVYYHLERFLAEFGKLGFSGMPEKVHIILGFGYDFDNDGQNDDFLAGATDVMGSPGLLVGSWGDRNLAYDPDVFGHELTHLVTAAVNPLDVVLTPTGISLPAGSLTEGTADYFSCSFMGDPDVGEYTASALGYPYLSSVENGATCPDDLLGESHVDGQVWSAALWEIREAIGAEKTDVAVFETVSNLEWGFSFDDAVDLLLNRLDATESEREEVEGILQARGLDSCEPFKPVEIGGSAEVYVPPVDVEIWSADHSELLGPECAPTALQLVVDVPAQTTSIEIEIVIPEVEPVEAQDVNVYVRFGQPVEYGFEQDELTVEADGMFPASDSIILNDESSPLLNAGSLYLSICHSGYEDGTVQVSVE